MSEFLNRRRFIETAGALAAMPLVARRAFAAESVHSPKVSPADWTSADVAQAFGRFAQERRKPEGLEEWLTNPEIQKIEPYRVFENVWCVGIRWVSAYVVKTTDGWALIDTLHEPFVDRLLENLKVVGVKHEDVKLVLMTHGHFDHVGGYYRLIKLLPNARFVMTRRGWEEAAASSRAGHGGRWVMDETVGTVAKDGDVFKLGDNVFTLLETPGHTWGTASYMYTVRHGGRGHTAVTVGGQGLNAIDGPSQIDAYIASMKKLADPKYGIDVDLTAHPFSTGLTEMIPAIVAAGPKDPHPLVNRAAYTARLDRLIANARLMKERRYGAKAS